MREKITRALMFLVALILIPVLISNYKSKLGGGVIK